MNQFILLIGIVMMLCMLMQKLTSKLPVPSLLMFLMLGMLFGVDGLFKISFNNYQISEIICSVCLIFIMFYGGFGTNFKAARPVMIRSSLLATLGVILSALFTGLFVHFFLKLELLESFLIGSVIASTDAASVFGILRSKNLNLKDNTASLLEVESGSNDPISYMLTMVLCTLLAGKQISVFSLLFTQIAVGLLLGFVSGKLTSEFIKRAYVSTDGLNIFVFAVVLLTYALSSILNGNAYLSVYLCGIILGNAHIPNKRNLVHFFDALTNMAQMMIFFLLGLLVTPSELPEVFYPALYIMIFLTLIGRPLAVLMTLLPFKPTINQIGLVSWAGLRGVASIVFAIMAVLSGADLHYNLFNLVFCVVLLSISIQGTFLPLVSKKLDMIDNTSDVFKTFNDYQEESTIRFIKIHIDEHHSWYHKSLSEIQIPASVLVVLILRKDGNIVPNGSTIIEKGDLLVLAAQEFTDQENLSMKEIVVDKNHRWVNRPLKDISLVKNNLVLMIKRNKDTIVPNGNTLICADDILVIAEYQ